MSLFSEPKPTEQHATIVASSAKTRRLASTTEHDTFFKFFEHVIETQTSVIDAKCSSTDAAGVSDVSDVSDFSDASVALFYDGCRRSLRLLRDLRAFETFEFLSERTLERCATWTSRINSTSSRRKVQSSGPQEATSLSVVLIVLVAPLVATFALRRSHVCGLSHPGVAAAGGGPGVHPLRREGPPAVLEQAAAGVHDCLQGDTRIEARDSTSS